MDDVVELGRVECGPLLQPVGDLEEPFRRILGCRRDFVGPDLARFLVDQHAVRERTANVDAKAIAGHQRRAVLPTVSFSALRNAAVAALLISMAGRSMTTP